jgi:hypothetical protein
LIAPTFNPEDISDKSAFDVTAVFPVDGGPAIVTKRMVLSIKRMRF